MSSTDSKINVNYLRKGVYHDKLSNISEDEEKTLSNSHKDKMLKMSNGINNILNDTKYKKIVNKLNN